MKDKKDLMRPLVLKLGVAFVLTISGFFLSRFRSKMIRFHHDKEDGSEGGSKELNDEGGVVNMEKVGEEVPQTPQKVISTTTVEFPPTKKNHDDEESLLLPEFDELIHKGFDETRFSSTEDAESVDSPMVREEGNVLSKLTGEEIREMEDEIISLQYMVKELQDKVRSLEDQLRKFYGLKEQEAYVRELENRLKVNATETQLFTVKIDRLQAENRKLAAQVSDYARVKAELESARSRIMQLENKIKTNAEQAKDQLSALLQKVSKLQEQEQKLAVEDGEIQKKLERLKDVEGELIDLTRVNSRLKDENSELASQLESAKLAYSALEEKKAQELEEANCLREAKEELEKQIERLQTDRCADLEELVYLKWLNACLRYELRNYQPGGGKTIARDLSMNMSPKSEEKAKQLILKYASLGFDENSLGLMDFEFENFSEDGSSSQASTITEGEMDDTSLDFSSTTKNSTSNKFKIFSKMKRLVLRKDHHRSHSQVSSVDKTPMSCGTSCDLASIGPFNDGAKVGRAASDLSAMRVKPFYDPTTLAVPHEQTDSQTIARLSLDLQRLKALCNNEEQITNLVPSHKHANTVLGEGGIRELVHKNHQLNISDHENAPEKLELKKYAQALNGSHRNQKPRRKSTSFASF